MNTEAMKLADWAARSGVSRQWAMRLCQEGRLEGAYRDGAGWWMVPSGALLPGRKVSQWLVERRDARAEREAQHKQAKAARIEALRGARQARGAVLTDGLRRMIDRAIAADCVLLDGSDGQWMDAESIIRPALPGWSAAGEAYYRSVKGQS